MNTFSNQIGFLSDDGFLDQTDPIYREADQDAVTTDSFGDSITTITVRNHGTLPDDEIDYVTLLRNGTAIANATESTGGYWIIEPDPQTAHFGPGNGTEFRLETTLGENATAGETVELEIPAVSDGGTPGAYDPGDTGLFFEQDDPVGKIGPGARLTVEGDTDTSDDDEVDDDPSTTVSLDLSIVDITTDVTAGDEPISATVTGTEPGRDVVASLLSLENESVVSKVTDTLDDSGRMTVEFDPDPGRYRLQITDPSTGSGLRSRPVRVREPDGTATFENESYRVERGAVARFNVSLSAADRARLRVTDPAGRLVDEVRITASNETNVSVAFNTSIAGRGPPGNGIHAEMPLANTSQRDDGPAGDAGAPGVDGQDVGIDGVDVGTDRGAVVPTPPGKETASNRSYPLAAGRYSLELSVRERPTDEANLSLTDSWNGSVRTFVAPHGTNLSSPGSIRNATTNRTRTAVGDVVVVRIRTTGLGQFYNGVESFNPGSAVARTYGAYAALEHRRDRNDTARNGPGHHGGNETTNPGFGPSQTVWDVPNGTVYLVTDTGEVDGFKSTVGHAFRATFTLNESSPFVGGEGTDDEVEAESIGSNLTFVEPSANFSGVGPNGSMNLSAEDDVPIRGTTNVAPGTNVTVRIITPAENESLEFENVTTIGDSTTTENATTIENSTTNESATTIENSTTVQDDGSYSTSVDMSEFDDGTEYTVVASANDERISPLRSGHVIDSSASVMQSVGGGGGGGGTGRHSNDRPETTASTTTQTVEPPEQTAGSTRTTTDSPRRHLVSPLTNLPEEPVNLGPISLSLDLTTLIVLAVVLLSLLVALLGAFRLT
ncbi:MAG: hypothetical protein ACOCY7_01805 [Halodesulfurarchaeum sp.]